MGAFADAFPGLSEDAIAATRRAGRTGAAAESEFFKRAMAFDPRAAAGETSRAIGSRLVNDPTQGLGRQLDVLRGESAGRFRSDTGFFLEDRERIFSDFNQRLSDAIAANSLQAEGLNLRNIQGIGSFGQNVQNRFTNLLGGSLDRGQQQQNAQGGSLFGRLLGGAAGLVGGSVLPGIGNVVGNRLGEAIAGGIGGNPNTASGR